MSDQTNSSEAMDTGDGHRHRLDMPCDVSPMPFHLYRPYRPLTLPDPTWPDRDRFILSKGHAAIGKQYVERDE